MQSNYQVIAMYRNVNADDELSHPYIGKMFFLESGNLSVTIAQRVPDASRAMGRDLNHKCQRRGA